MSSEKYLAMLNELFEKLPKKPEERKSRFYIPRPEVYFEGRKTVIVNFKKIVTSMNRDVKILSSYLGKELAAPVLYDDPRLIIQARVDSDSLSSALTLFVKKYVLCPACKGPDTKLVKRRRLIILKCEICGAETVVPPV